MCLLAGCSQTENRNRGVFLLLDTSGTYALELKKARSIINYLLGTLEPGDTFAVASIDTGSFSEKDIVAKMTFDQRPSTTNNQKRLFIKKIDEFVQNVSKSKYTDISGGVLQAIDYLNEVGTGKKYILIFSDLKEELADGHIRDVPFELEGFKVIALNVTKLRTDIKDPKQYLKRVEVWRQKVEQRDESGRSHGGVWDRINDLERLDAIFKK
ncbi:MAG: VWA domain-containing protein [Desulfobacteraceae bacterium]|nr:VWA domain-containing protein [Desulfobacteraceae bacterium]